MEDWVLPYGFSILIAMGMADKAWNYLSLSL